MPKFLPAIGLVALLTCLNPVHAQHVDPHILYEENCTRCHTPHAGDFVFENLDLLGETLVGKKSGKPVSVYLEAGHGGLAPDEVQIMMDHFMSIRQSGRLFRKKCRICHVNARELARLDLVLRDGALVGRYSGRDISQFLLNHGRLDSTEVKTMVDVLKRQLAAAP